MLRISTENSPSFLEQLKLYLSDRARLGPGSLSSSYLEWMESKEPFRPIIKFQSSLYRNEMDKWLESIDFVVFILNIYTRKMTISSRLKEWIDSQTCQGRLIAEHGASHILKIINLPRFDIQRGFSTADFIAFAQLIQELYLLFRIKHQTYAVPSHFVFTDRSLCLCIPHRGDPLWCTPQNKFTPLASYPNYEVPKLVLVSIWIPFLLEADRMHNLLSISHNSIDKSHLLFNPDTLQVSICGSGSLRGEKEDPGSYSQDILDCGRLMIDMTRSWYAECGRRKDQCVVADSECIRRFLEAMAAANMPATRRIRTTLVHMLLNMTDRDPRVRPSVTRVLHQLYLYRAAICDMSRRHTRSVAEMSPVPIERSSRLIDRVLKVN